jgi:hypothetical protein
LVQVINVSRSKRLYAKPCAVPQAKGSSRSPTKAADANTNDRNAKARRGMAGLLGEEVLANALYHVALAAC